MNIKSFKQWNFFEKKIYQENNYKILSRQRLPSARLAYTEDWVRTLQIRRSPPLLPSSILSIKSSLLLFSAAMRGIRTVNDKYQDDCLCISLLEDLTVSCVFSFILIFFFHCITLFAYLIRIFRYNISYHRNNDRKTK